MYRYPNTEKWLSDRAIGEQLGTNGLGGVLKKVPDINRYDDWKTLPQALMNFVSQYESEWTLLLTGSLISTMPLLLIYLSAQKYVVQGFVHSGIKG